MTTAELNQYLENIAKLIEATANDPAAAAKIVRDSKVKAQKRVAAPTTDPLLRHPERRAGSLTPAALIITE